MSEFTTTARPYAKAVYDIASETNSVDEWSEALELMSAVAANETIVRLLDDPQLKQEQKGQMFLKVTGDNLNAAQKNLVLLMAENGRLKIMPVVAEQFEIHRAAAQGKIEATAISAFPLSKAQENTITKMLKDKLGREVTLTTTIDESLIGGVVIKAGDTIIDGSMKAQLDMLATTLSR